jgi:streptomycin 6-kinase
MDWMRGAFADARSCKDLERARGYIEQIPRVKSMMGILMEPDEPQMLLHGDLHHWNILSDADRGWMAIDPKGVIGASCLDVGRFINNAMGFGETAAEKREILLEAVTIFSDVLGENEERMFAGAFCDKIMGSSWGLKQKPDEQEASSQEALKVMVEVAKDVDDRRLRCRAVG